jgi:hypothetical protein
MGLAWMRAGPSSKTRCPSFSWASIDGPVQWEDFGWHEVSEAKFSVKDMVIEHEGNDIYGRIKSGYLKLFGLCRQAWIVYDTGVSNYNSSGLDNDQVFNYKSFQSCIARTLFQMPAFQSVTLSAARTGWESFSGEGDVLASLKCNVKRQLALLDRDWEN